MATLKPLAVSAASKELRAELPESLMKAFALSPRIVIKEHPAGLWPVDPGILRKIDLERLMLDKEFNEKYEVIVMPKAGL